MKHLTPYRQKRNIPLAGEGEKDGVWGGLRDYRMNPTGQFLNVLLEHLTVNHAEKQTRLLVINGVVINISPIYKTAHSLAIKNGLVVAGNNFGDRHIMTAFRHQTYRWQFGLG